jgi:uncharacterized protein YegL
MEPHHINSKKSVALFIVFCLTFYSFFRNCQAQDAAPRHSVLLLIDVSGSMSGVKIDSVKSAAKQIIKMLVPCNTEFSIMGFSGKKENPVPFRLDFTKDVFDLLSFIDNLKPEGGTLLGTALKAASFYCTAHKGSTPAHQSIMLLSDGRSDDDIPAALKELKEKNALTQCECIGYVIDNDKTAEGQLKQIAAETGGEYYAATDVSSIIKAFLKTSIKTIIHDIPVVVRQGNGKLNFQLNTDNAYNLLTRQNWIVDSIQINVSEALYDITQSISEENMQDTLPKSLVFDNYKKVSLFINKGMPGDTHKKWTEGGFTFNKNALAITVLHYYLKLVVKSVDQHSLVLCVNKFKNLTDNIGEVNEEACDCANKMSETQPYILIYFSQAGCNH